VCPGLQMTQLTTQSASESPGCQPGGLLVSPTATHHTLAFKTVVLRSDVGLESNVFNPDQIGAGCRSPCGHGCVGDPCGCQCSRGGGHRAGAREGRAD
jgi:hypothetical protein